MLALERVSKRYAGRLAADGLDLAVAPGQTTVLIGPSGSGKTTLLRLLVGLLEPDEGVVRFHGEALTRENVLAVRRRIGYVIQEGGLFPHLTAARNSSIVAEHLGWDAKRIGERLRELAALVRLPVELLGRYPAQLSGGERQRVALLRALVLDPDALLLDEPLGALDPMIRNALAAELAAVFRTLGKTVVLVTHDLAEARFFADEIVLLRDGRIVQRGAYEDLESAPADPFVGEFLRAQRAPARVGAT